MIRSMIVAGGTAFALMAVLSNASAQDSADISESSSYTKITDIRYASVDGRELALDLYFPQGADNPPLLVWIHGGRWLRRTKEDVFTLGLIDHDFAMASIDFRLAGEAVFPAQVHDIKAAIRFLRAKAPAYG